MIYLGDDLRRVLTHLKDAVFLLNDVGGFFDTHGNTSTHSERLPERPVADSCVITAK